MTNKLRLSKERYSLCSNTLLDEETPCCQAPLRIEKPSALGLGGHIQENRKSVVSNREAQLHTLKLTTLSFYLSLIRTLTHQRKQDNGNREKARQWDSMKGNEAAMSYHHTYRNWLLSSFQRASLMYDGSKN